jgi:hypothetical protein
MGAPEKFLNFGRRGQRAVGVGGVTPPGLSFCGAFLRKLQRPMDQVDAAVRGGVWGKAVALLAVFSETLNGMRRTRRRPCRA